MPGPLDMDTLARRAALARQSAGLVAGAQPQLPPEIQAPDRQTDLPVDELYRRGMQQMLGYQGPPLSVDDRVQALGNLAGSAMSMRGGFGDAPFSQVMQGGRPTQVYHGTPRAFELHDPSTARQGLYGKGVYFSEDPKYASMYATGPQANVRPAYLDITKPFDIQTMRTAPPDAVRQRGLELLEEVSSALSNTERAPVLDAIKRVRAGESPVKFLHGDLLTQLAKETGHDGIRAMEGGSPIWVAFESKQILNPYEYAKTLGRTQ